MFWKEWKWWIIKRKLSLKTKISELEEYNAELSKQNSILKSLKSKSEEIKITELRNYKVIKIVDQTFSKDKLDLQK